MSAWSEILGAKSRYNSSLLPGGLALAGFFPLERRELGDLVVGHGGKPLQDIFEVSAGFDPMHSAVLDERMSVNSAALRTPAFSDPKRASFSFRWSWVESAFS